MRRFARINWANWVNSARTVAKQKSIAYIQMSEYKEYVIAGKQQTDTRIFTEVRRY